MLKYSLSDRIPKYINGPGDSDEAKDLYIYADRLYLVGGSDGEAFLAIYDKDLNTFLFKKFNKLLVFSGIQYFSDVAWISLTINCTSTLQQQTKMSKRHSYTK